MFWTGTEALCGFLLSRKHKQEPTNVPDMGIMENRLWRRAQGTGHKEKI
jgi:hypothetical protein